MEPDLRLAFFKLNVPEIVPALAFWREAFGFEVAQTFDEAEFHEKVLALPAHAGGPSLMLVAYKDGRDVTVGHGHGAVGIQTSDIAAAHERALSAGAQKGTGIITVGDGIKVAVLHSPQGHEIELVQLPG
uniref:VOC family protein n=1 Tax=Altererythrobacter segetis TaxID=1104773 RepID=UPI00140C9B2B|nr:VOC family protein [Altererythrobacter segetis]